ncbi:MAG TPA: rod shape-determining protein, partial [Desulfurivibrionaceae bacterium]|nr:rod shape-determining protein [Desulfurivibrionaceae bacterium]
RHRVALYPEDLEALTHELGSLLDPVAIEPRLLTLCGIDIIRRHQVEIAVRQDEIVGAMEPVLAKILRMIEVGIRKIPERFAAEVYAAGICLTGGGSCIQGIDRLIAARTNLAVRVAADPQHAVINGAKETLRFWKDRDDAWWNTITWPSLAA